MKKIIINLDTIQSKKHILNGALELIHSYSLRIATNSLDEDETPEQRRKELERQIDYIMWELLDLKLILDGIKQ